MNPIQLNWFKTLDDLLAAPAPAPIVQEPKKLDIPELVIRNKQTGHTVRGHSLNVGAKNSPRWKATDLLRDGLGRANLVSNIPMLAHMINWFEEGEKMPIETMANFTPELIDVWIENYMNRDYNVKFPQEETA